MFECVNCGEQNTLGDCCPDCCGRECDRCGEEIALDEDIARGDLVICQKCDQEL